MYSHLLSLYNAAVNPQVRRQKTIVTKKIIQERNPSQPSDVPILENRSGSSELVIIMPKSASARVVVLPGMPGKYANLGKDELNEEDLVTVNLATKILSDLDEMDSAGVTLGRIVKDKPKYHEQLIKVRGI